MRILLIILEIIIKSFFGFVFTIGGIIIGYLVFYKMGLMKENIDHFIFGSVTGVAIGIILMLIEKGGRLWNNL